MKKHLLLFALLAISAMAIMPAFAAGKTSNTILAKVKPANPTQDIPVVGTFANGNFAGTLDIIQFARRGSQIVAIGSLTGTLTDALGNTVGSVSGTRVELPVTQLVGSCEILHLELGPVDLDLLGLVVHLDQVVLDISAEAGAGNLLGNLLCAITHLLDGPGSIIAIINLLNNILGAIG
jgi:hypothetical protein